MKKNSFVCCCCCRFCIEVNFQVSFSELLLLGLTLKSLFSSMQLNTTDVVLLIYLHTTLTEACHNNWKLSVTIKKWEFLCIPPYKRDKGKECLILVIRGHDDINLHAIYICIYIYTDIYLYMTQTMLYLRTILNKWPSL